MRATQQEASKKQHLRTVSIGFATVAMEMESKARPFLGCPKLEASCDKVQIIWMVNFTIISNYVQARE
jgi:hypothetical protein